MGYFFSRCLTESKIKLFMRSIASKSLSLSLSPPSTDTQLKASLKTKYQKFNPRLDICVKNLNYKKKRRRQGTPLIVSFEATRDSLIYVFKSPVADILPLCWQNYTQSFFQTRFALSVHLFSSGEVNRG